MVLGMTSFTFFHVLVSLVGIVSGFVVLAGFFNANPLPGWTAVFLATTIVTSVTGFGFPFGTLLPSHKLGILSLIVLAAAIYARYGRKLIGGARPLYVIAAVAAQYFNVFVLVVQLFKHVPLLERLAPTQTERPFVVTQLVVGIVFVAAGVRAVKWFHPMRGGAVSASASTALRV